MPDGIDFKPDIFLPRAFFKTPQDLEETIETTKETMDSIILELSMYAVVSPKEITPEDWKEDSVMFIKTKIKDLIEDFLELHRNLVFYELFKEHLENTGEEIIEYYPFKI